MNTKAMLAAGIALATSGVAHGAEGLRWTWDSPRRYYLEADVSYPEPLLLQEEENVEARMWAATTRVITTCAPNGKAGKKSIEVRCTIDDIAMAAAPYEGDADRLVAVLDSVEGMLKGAWVQLEFGFDGRVRSIDLEGLTSKNVNDRVRATQETMRLILARAFAGFDLELPENGTDGGAAWTQSGAQAIGFPSQGGTVGVVDVNVAVARQSGDVVTMTTRAEGVAAPGVVVAGLGTLANQYAMKMTGSASFDVGKHTLVGRQYTVEGDPTASSITATGGAGVRYVQKVQLRLLGDDEPLPQIGDNMLRDR